MTPACRCARADARTETPAPVAIVPRYVRSASPARSRCCRRAACRARCPRRCASRSWAARDWRRVHVHGRRGAEDHVADIRDEPERRQRHPLRGDGERPVQNGGDVLRTRGAIRCSQSPWATKRRTSVGSRSSVVIVLICRLALALARRHASAKPQAESNKPQQIRHLSRSKAIS